MNEPIDLLSRLLSDVILPSLQAVQESQNQQIASNERLEDAIEELRLDLAAQFSHLLAQLTACRAELAATQAVLNATQAGPLAHDRTALIH